jgi:hypothetical protein
MNSSARLFFTPTLPEQRDHLGKIAASAWGWPTLMPGEPRRTCLLDEATLRRRHHSSRRYRPLVAVFYHFRAIMDRQPVLVFDAGLLDSLGGLLTADFFVRNWLISNLRNVSRISTMRGIKVPDELVCLAIPIQNARKVLKLRCVRRAFVRR